MPDGPVTNPDHAETQKHSAESQTPAAISARSQHRSAVLRWPTYAALAISLVAATLAAIAYFHPAHTTAVGTAQQGGDAKANVCSAYAAAHKAVVINTHLQSRNPNDQTAELAVATNARLALIGSGAYLKDRLAANNAAPADLVSAVDAVAGTVEQLGINYLTRAGADAQNSLRHDLENQLAQADKLCA